MKMKYENIIETLLANFPALKTAYEVESDYLAGLPHLFFEIIFIPYFKELTASDGQEQTKAVGFLEQMLCSADERVQELAQVSGLEALVPERELLAGIRNRLGPKTQANLLHLEKYYGWDRNAAEGKASTPEYIVRPLSAEQIADLCRTEQPFTVFGRLVPVFDGRSWSFTETLLAKTYEYKYPAEKIDLTEFIGNPKKTVLVIYAGNECHGHIRLRRNWNGFCFIENIAVAARYRGQGIGGQLLAAAETWAKERGLKGFMLETQDFNLNACRLYHRRGFVIGAVDNLLYHNTPNKEDLAIFWYKLF